MLTPIRIGGSGGVSTSLSGVTVNYVSPDGEVWNLTPDPRGAGDTPMIVLIAEEVTGFEGRVERTTGESVNGLGVRSLGWRTPPLDITLGYLLRAGRGDLPAWRAAWRSAWEIDVPGDYPGDLAPAEPGRLEVATGGGERFWTPVVDAVFPDLPHGLGGETRLQESMTCRSLVGHWFGETESYEGSFTFTVRGDRPLSPSMRLVWDGSATSVTFPSGLTLNLGAINQPRFINLDRGKSGQVTRPDGSVDTLAWSNLQGLVHGMALRPESESTWVLGSGLTLEVTPRFLSPWR